MELSDVCMRGSNTPIKKTMHLENQLQKKKSESMSVWSHSLLCMHYYLKKNISEYTIYNKQTQMNDMSYKKSANMLYANRTGVCTFTHSFTSTDGTKEVSHFW